ncbi:unnamed protein product [Urochloa humidicola]
MQTRRHGNAGMRRRRRGRTVSGSSADPLDHRARATYTSPGRTWGAACPHLPSTVLHSYLMFHLRSGRDGVPPADKNELPTEEKKDVDMVPAEEKKETNLGVAASSDGGYAATSCQCGFERIGDAR